MRRELLLIGEMIDAATQAQSLVAGTDLDALQADRQRRDALLWNFTVLGEAAAQLDDDGCFPDMPCNSRRSNERVPPLSGQAISVVRSAVVIVFAQARFRGLLELLHGVDAGDHRPHAPENDVEPLQNPPETARSGVLFESSYGEAKAGQL